MAVIGGFILVIIGAFLLWIALMSKFKKIGKKVTKKVTKTFGENKNKTEEKGEF